MILFRMAQEALNNAIKHSKATNIEVQLEYNDSYFRLAIDDDGIGFNPALLESVKTGIGLKSIQKQGCINWWYFFYSFGHSNGCHHYH